MGKTVIEVKPFRDGWQSFEAPGVAPYFGDRDQAIRYAETRIQFQSGEIRIFNDNGLEEIRSFNDRGRRL